MTEPTRTDIIRAYEALDDICNLVIMGRGYPANEYRNLILAALPPKPQPTMAEIEWDDDLHYLAEAENVEWGTVIMLRYERGFDRIQIFDTGTPNKFGFALPASLTPTGKRYTLTEVQE